MGEVHDIFGARHRPLDILAIGDMPRMTSTRGELKGGDWSPAPRDTTRTGRPAATSLETRCAPMKPEPRTRPDRAPAYLSWQRFLGGLRRLGGAAWRPGFRRH